MISSILYFLPLQILPIQFLFQLNLFFTLQYFAASQSDISQSFSFAIKYSHFLRKSPNLTSHQINDMDIITDLIPRPACYQYFLLSLISRNLFLFTEFFRICPSSWQPSTLTTTLLTL